MNLKSQKEIRADNINSLIVKIICMDKVAFDELFRESEGKQALWECDKGNHGI